MLFRRCLFPLAIVLAAPILGAGDAIRADFVLDASGCVDVGVSAKNGGSVDLSPVAACSVVFSKNDSSKSPKELDPHESVRQQRGAPTGGGERPAPFGPQEQAPKDSDAHQSMGGTSNNLGAGTGVYAASSPSIPVIIGADLAMRYFAREGHLQIEEQAWRFFRPPRSSSFIMANSGSVVPLKKNLSPLRILQHALRGLAS